MVHVAFGLQENVYSQMEDSADVDIYLLVSTDSGATWTEPKAITAGNALGWLAVDVEDFGTQIKVRPDGRETYTVWSGDDGQSVNVLFRRGMEGEFEIEMEDIEREEPPEKVKKPKN